MVLNHGSTLLQKARWKMSKKYSVKVTVTGYMYFNEIADSEDDAISSVREYVMNDPLEHKDFEFDYEIIESEGEDE